MLRFLLSKFKSIIMITAPMKFKNEHENYSF